MRGRTIIEEGAEIRGDQAIVHIGGCCIIGENSVIACPTRGSGSHQGASEHLPVVIGEHVIIEKDCHIQAASIGSYVHIGKRCKIGERCIISSCSRILDDTILPEGTVVPPHAVFSGNPGTQTSSCPESFQHSVKALTYDYFRCFQKEK